MKKKQKTSLIRASFLSPDAALSIFYLLYFLYSINDLIIKSENLEKILWNLIKSELFYVAGKCRNCSKCCRKMTLIHNNINIDTSEKFRKISTTDPYYLNFKPAYLDKDNNNPVISYFACQLLNRDGMCSDYRCRPDFCHDFPVSSFIQNDHITEFCGYKIKRTKINPCFSNKSLKLRVSNINKHL
ncbi:MAG: YkgJ family cysteine cluster protein [bacterium]|nr:YkgJ family cysteine cluster protein [bacterium]